MKLKVSGYSLWIAVVPVFSPVSWLSLMNLRRWSALPRQWGLFLALFVGVQLLAACFTPAPAVSALTALVRSLLTVALIMTGWRLARSDVLRLAILGYALVAAVAFATTLLLPGHGLLSSRLVHPYYTTVSLGLGGALGVLTALTWKGGPGWLRWGGGLTCLLMFLWSGSRGPLVALLAGLLGIAAVSWRGRKGLLLANVGAALLGGGTLLVSSGTSGTVLSRLSDSTLNSRGAYWADALDAAQRWPLGGAGTYQLGPSLSTQFGESCQMWLASAQGFGEACPAWASQLRGAWLIAHNTALHLLGETGILGLSAWLALLAALTVCAWRSRDPLLNGLLWAGLAMGLVDNPTLLPSLGHAELFWLAGGIALARATAARPTTVTEEQPLAIGETVAVHAQSQTAQFQIDQSQRGYVHPFRWPVALLAAALLAYYTLPVWTLFWKSAAAPQLLAITLPQQVSSQSAQTFFVRLANPLSLQTSQSAENAYRLKGVACLENSAQCFTAFQSTVLNKGVGWHNLALSPLPAGQYRLSVTVYDARSSQNAERALARLSRPLTVR